MVWDYQEDALSFPLRLPKNMFDNRVPALLNKQKREGLGGWC
jgi:hypothetical protein